METDTHGLSSMCVFVKYIFLIFRIDHWYLQDSFGGGMGKAYVMVPA